jgi:formate/nitrite transporter FocA (FNT family)
MSLSVLRGIGVSCVQCLFVSASVGATMLFVSLLGLAMCVWVCCLCGFDHVIAGFHTVFS